MSKIFISYRHTDARAMAGRIFDQLKARYGDDSVYMGYNIPFGTDFPKDIFAALDQADALIAVVGPRWLGPRRNGRHRIMDDGDFVRVEIEGALKRGILVVPVLVDGAVMPDAASLPESMKPFASRNAASVDAGIDFQQQVERLARSVDRISREKRLGARLVRLLDRARPKLRASLVALAAVAALSAATLWSPMEKFGRDGLFKGGIGGPRVPVAPPGRSQWVVEKSMVYLEPTGDKRQFFLIEPSLELTAQGAQPGSLLFDGRKIDNSSYEGKLFVFAGRCGTRDYDVAGRITNDDQTVTLVGMAPRIDLESCLKIDEQERTVVFNYKRTIN